MTEDLVEATLNPTDSALKDSGLSVKDINKVILVGGSTRIPAIQEAIKNKLGKDIHKGINPDECVALGAAIQGGVLTGEVHDVLLLDVTPLSLGIETLGGIATKIIERNTTIPTSKSQVFSTAVDNQPSVDINIVQGERRLANDNKHLGRFMLHGIASAPRGIPQIEVMFDIDANGILNVSAKDKGTGKEQKITITGSTGLSKEEINKMAKDAEKFAEEDRKKTELIELKNESDSLIYQGEKLLKENDKKIDENEKNKFKESKTILQKAIEKDNIEDMKKEKENIQKILQDIGMKMYQESQKQTQKNQEKKQEETNNKKNNKEEEIKKSKKENEEVINAKYTAKDKEKKDK